ncbi:2TM domain-containing protein [Rathayibacter toxicus]|uniref:2TM domain-containing protein n=1 Tax=Rathayibacter toxicus TaxID=145458 RepID=A0A0C5BEV1_9MICO|nr:2TM domain-containing protein [Rathayibacter toxicus]AJM77534.1 hypothetical protein TI83_05445 [Rathayibacter toxicus]ALS56546.1 hypothetical protein APU90_01030 [Rathayibacter toxicus]KKM44643.1 hypothetical protein VT73_08995 [Rathayibacter toxicus]PPG21628.1 hypothetical protein C5D15_05240 [Rathayibacter toxicus]PPG46590.1 hypothetical protein C5D16_05215 [Rathayibacter toxicus]
MADVAYPQRRARAFRAFRMYLIGSAACVVINVIVIAVVPGYSFPQNFWAIWPLLGWGVPTVWRLFELRRYRHDHA